MEKFALHNFVPALLIDRARRISDLLSILDYRLHMLNHWIEYYNSVEAMQETEFDLVGQELKDGVLKDVMTNIEQAKTEVSNISQTLQNLFNNEK